MRYTAAICAMMVLGLAAGLAWAQYPAPSADPQGPSGPSGTPPPNPFGVDPSVAVVIGSIFVLVVMVAIVALGRSGSNARGRTSS